MSPWAAAPRWGGGPGAAPSPGAEEPLEICLALTGHLFELAVRAALGAARAALGALGLRGRGGAAGAWLLGLGAFAAVGAGLRALLRHLLPLAALYAALQALVLLASLRRPPAAPPEPPREPPDGREPPPGRREGPPERGEGWETPPQKQRWEPPDPEGKGGGEGLRQQ